MIRTSLVRLSSSDLAIQRSTKLRNAMCPTKTRTLPFPTLRSTAPPTFADFQDYACQSLEGADSLAKGTILSMVESAQGGWICQVRTHNLCDRGRPLTVIGRSVHIIPTVLADDQGKVCVTQSCQLICLFHKVRFPSGELLRLRFCRVRHIMRFLALNTGIKVKLDGESKRLNENNLASN